MLFCLPALWFRTTLNSTPVAQYSGSAVFWFCNTQRWSTHRILSRLTHPCSPVWNYICGWCLCMSRRTHTGTPRVHSEGTGVPGTHYQLRWHWWHILETFWWHISVTHFGDIFWWQFGDRLSNYPISWHVATDRTNQMARCKSVQSGVRIDTFNRPIRTKERWREEESTAAGGREKKKEKHTFKTGKI